MTKKYGICLCLSKEEKTAGEQCQGLRPDQNNLTCAVCCWVRRSRLDLPRRSKPFGQKSTKSEITSIKSPAASMPGLSLEIAKKFAAEYLPDYEVVIVTHIDEGHIHSHLVFNSVNAQTGEKYHNLDIGILPPNSRHIRQAVPGAWFVRYYGRPADPSS